MHFTIKEMNENHAKEISTWTYKEPYNIYDGDDSEEFTKELMDGSYFSVVDENSDLIGYYCYGESAQVPAGKLCGVYAQELLDVGLGMRPDLCGKGNGYDFFVNGLKFAQSKYSSKKFRLTVAAFNERAIKLYEKIGFVKTDTFVRAHSEEDSTFQVMVLEI
ncbi:MAG: GNAT family N-acetyltransferase [Clostridiales bacterium]|nr:GNAT family N-acetyltransferase [Clostridiales bacterium]